MKKLLYLSDLYNYYVGQNKNVKFSSKDNDTTIVVHVDEPFTYSESEDDELNMYCPIRLCHTLSNRNKSYISEKAMNEAIPTAYNMPILGYVYEDDNKEFQFAGHEFFIDNNNELVYEESPLGVIPESAELKLVKYDGDDRSYLEGTGIIWRTYSKASDIIEREKELSVSVELMVDELSFDSKNKELVIDKFRFSGVTILGRDRNTGAEIQPGMENSMISIADFSEKNNSVFSSNKVIELLSALNEKLDNLNINESFKEGGNQSVKKKFEEVTEAEVKETPSAEVFDGEENPEETDYYEEEGGGDNDDPPADDPTDPPADDPTDPPADDDDDDDDGDDDDADPSGIPLGQRDDDDTAGDSKKKYSVSITRDDKTQTFSVSLQDKIEALYTLVNDTYSEQDAVWYDVDVYDDDKYIIMHSWWSNNAYKQSYKVKKDIYSLVGDRVPVKAVWCTEDEQKALEQMKANYSSIVEELSQYKAEPEKLAVLQNEDYAQIRDTDAYKELAQRDTYFSMSKDELEKKLDACLLDYAKHNEIKFSADSKKATGMKLFGNPSKKSTNKKGRYGGIFNKEN